MSEVRSTKILPVTFSLLVAVPDQTVLGSVRPCLHGNGSMWSPTSTVRRGSAFTRGLMEPFLTEPLAVPEMVHLESRSRMEPN